MNKAEHDRICTAVSHGKNQSLEHQITRRHGQVTSCTANGFNVLIEGEKSHWATQNSEKDNG